MNTLYKKIALVCLVSLTANQAAQAFQFSDVLGWFKSNQKSVACVTVLAAMTAALCYFKYTKVAAAAAHKVQDAAANEVQNYGPFEDMIKELRATQSTESAKAKIKALEEIIQGTFNEGSGIHYDDGCRAYNCHDRRNNEFIGYCFYVRSKERNIGRVIINVDGEYRTKKIDEVLSGILNDFKDDIGLYEQSNSRENDALLRKNLIEADGGIKLVHNEYNPPIYCRKHVRAEQPALLAGQDEAVFDDEE